MCSLRAPLGGHIARGAGRGRGGAARRPREPWPRRRPPSWECGGSSACARISPATPRRSRRSTASARSSRCGRTRARGRAFARGASARVRATRAACAAGRRARRRHHAGNRSRCNGVRCERAPRACLTCGVLGLSLGRLRERREHGRRDRTALLFLGLVVTDACVLKPAPTPGPLATHARLMTRRASRAPRMAPERPPTPNR